LKATNEMLTFQCVAYQLAQVGWGNHNYGTMKLKGDIVDLKELFNEHEVLHSLPESSKLKPDDITPARIVRIFRFHVASYFKKTKKTSFIYKKYVLNKNVEGSRWNIFPGSESLLTAPEDLNMLYSAYKEMDKRLNAKFVNRMQRVLLARGIEHDFN
jgi:hypothetical protein